MSQLRSTRFSQQFSHGNGINVVALCKNDERYILLYTDQHRSEALRQLGRWATDRKLSFDWYDAAKLSQSVRERNGTEP